MKIEFQEMLEALSDAGWKCPDCGLAYVIDPTRIGRPYVLAERPDGPCPVCLSFEGGRPSLRPPPEPTPKPEPKTIEPKPLSPKALTLEQEAANPPSEAVLACSKVCSRCGVRKHKLEFSVNARCKDGLTSACKNCHSEAYYAKRLDK